MRMAFSENEALTALFSAAFGRLVAADERDDEVLVFLDMDDSGECYR